MKDKKKGIQLELKWRKKQKLILNVEIIRKADDQDGIKRKATQWKTSMKAQRKT